MYTLYIHYIYTMHTYIHTYIHTYDYMIYSIHGLPGRTQWRPATSSPRNAWAHHQSLDLDVF